MANKKALHITSEAKDSTFIDCDIEGAQIEGLRTKMVRTKIYNFRKKYPGLWTGIVSTLLVAIISGVVLLFVEYNYFCF